MKTPIFDEVNTTHNIYKESAKLEAKAEVIAEIKKIPKPTKQLIELLKTLEGK